MVAPQNSGQLASLPPGFQTLPQGQPAEPTQPAQAPSQPDDPWGGFPAAPAAQTQPSVPQAFLNRLDAGNAAREREGGLAQTIPQFIDLMKSPEGRTRLWDTVKQYPLLAAKGMAETLAVPGNVASGQIDLNTEQGLDQAIGLGALVGLGRFNKLNVTGKTSGLSVAAGEPFGRIERAPDGTIYDRPIGNLPQPADFDAANHALTGGQPSEATAGKLQRVWDEQGVHPAEAVTDAEKDPATKGELLSKGDTLPERYGGGSGKPPVPPEEPPASGAQAQPPAPGSLDEAQSKILSRVSVGEDTAKRGYSLDRLYTDWVDKFFPISKQVAGAAEKPEGVPQDPYKLARLYAGWAGKADTFIEHGSFDFHTYEVNGPSLKDILDPVKNDMDGFRAFAVAARAAELETRGIKTGIDLDAVQKVGDAGIAKYGPTLEKLVNYQNHMAEYLRDSGVLSREGFDAMTQANRLFVPFHRVIGEADFMQRLSGGSLSPRNPIKHIEGSERVIIDPIESIIKNTYLLTQMAERNVVGTKLVDLLVKNKAGPDEIKNLPVLKSSGDVERFLASEGTPKEGLENLGDALRQAAEPAKEGEISIFRNGKRVSYDVDPELAASFKNLDAQTAGLIEKLLQPLSSTLRAGAVLNPDFQLRHSFRDYLYAFITTGKGVFTPLDMARGFAGLITRDSDFWNWQKGGGGQISMVALDRRYLQESLDQLTDKTGLMTRAWNVVVDPEATWLQKGGAVAGLPFNAVSKYVIHPLQVVTEIVTSASHLGAFKKAMRGLEASAPQPTGRNLPVPIDTAGLPAKGEYVLAPGSSLADAIKIDSTGKAKILEAAWVARDTAIDAARIGAKMRSYNMISAFANIKVQDADRVVRALKDNPVSAGIKIAAGITAPSVILWVMNHDDSRVKELPEWERDMFWIVPTDKWEPSTPQQAATRPADQVRIVDGKLMVNNGTIFRIPKPFGAGVVFGSGAERLLAAFASDKPNAFKGYLHSLMESNAGDLVPNAVTPLIEQWSNRSLFTGRSLIPGNLEKELPEYQYLPYTTETAKKLAQVISAFPGMRDASLQSTALPGAPARALTTPILIENYIRGWTGTLGVYAMNAVDFGARKAGIVPSPNYPSSTLADVPVIKAFVARYPSATTQSIQDFYDRYQAEQHFQATFRAKAKEGDIDAMMRVQQAGGEAVFNTLAGVQKTLGAHLKMITEIQRNPTIQPYEKRQLVDSLYYGMIKTAQFGNMLLDKRRELRPSAPEPQPEAQAQ